MADKTTSHRMINLCFRTDPELIILFYKHCKDNNLTRSEGFRQIFNQHMIKNFIKTKQNETNDLERS